jgi:serine/threonine-protein kinase ATR
MGVMRKEADPLVAVLSTFIYDPLVEWGSKQAKTSGGNKDGVETLEQVKSRLKGFSKKKKGLPLSVAGQVNSLIEEATSADNLSAMYVGWAPFM